MSWDDDRANSEFGWLKLMARLKYDGYRDFQAGMRFVETLATWLQQFKPEERETAYMFLRKRLIYVGAAEMQRLVEQFYPRTVRDRILKIVAAERKMPIYRILADVDARASAERLRRQTLFMGLSDGARIDTVRHSNVGLLSNEQLVIATQVDKEKWEDLLGNLREDVRDADALFRLVYLIDDFAGTGTSFFRHNSQKEKWSGKLMRFKDSIEGACKAMDGKSPFAANWELGVHHYLASHEASQAIRARLGEAKQYLSAPGWASDIHVTFGAVLPVDIKIGAIAERDDAFIALTNAYYNDQIRTKHTDVGGVTHMGLGYGGCALPLVLDHNTPNNSVALLWAETGTTDRSGAPAPAMRPLFRRRQRHS